MVAPGIELDAWEFFSGKVGGEYAYGAKYGCDTECVREDKGSYVTETAVCVGKEAGKMPLLKLMAQNGEVLVDLDSCGLGKGKGSASSICRVFPRVRCLHHLTCVTGTAKGI